jgi:hypothetical protein
MDLLQFTFILSSEFMLLKISIARIKAAFVCVAGHNSLVCFAFPRLLDTRT